MVNSERLGRQVRPGFEPGTSHFPVLSTTTPPLVGQQFKGKSSLYLSHTNSHLKFMLKYFAGGTNWNDAQGFQNLEES